MTIRLQVYSNGDHAAVAWVPEDGRPIPECRGFALARSRADQVEYVHSFVGFTSGAPFPTADPWKWPLQRYLWWDYEVAAGDVVQYQVIPVTGAAVPDSLALRPELSSAWSGKVTISSQLTPHIAAFFNRGVVASQWLSRRLEAAGGSGRKTLLELIATPGNATRNELSAQLRVKLLGVLATTRETGGSLYAALYELNDPELLAALEQLGAAGHLILANGAFSSSKPDENAAARAQLKAHSQLEVVDREVSEGHFAHNKFAVVCDDTGAAQTVVTGSTNWTQTGLCTQANNAVVIDDHDVSSCFLTQWNTLKAAGSGYPKALFDDNAMTNAFTVDDVAITVSFAPTRKEQDLAHARELIANAKDGVLFLFFFPGTYQADPARETLLQEILELPTTDLYLRGVVNQQIAGVTEAQKSAGAKPVTLVGADGKTPLSTEVLVPANIKARFGDWLPETLGASEVMVHSKVVVIDPFGAHPVLMTGSHNLGMKASAKNDDNLVIFEGPAASPLATAYAVNIIAIYEAYHWNRSATHATGSAAPWAGLEDTDSWQDGHLEGVSLAELQFWTQSA
jgi:phosphatidylserine/phosphatidylglycerophosphate/cardiolipin synthase-like enzyme